MAGIEKTTFLNVPPIDVVWYNVLCGTTTRWKDITMYCECGCGGKTAIATMTDARYGATRGQPRRFLPGHHIYKSLAKYKVDENSGCWIWLRYVDPRSGYARTNLGKQDGYKKVNAYVPEWEQVHGKVPSGMALHHLCENKRCVNPSHLVLMSSESHGALHSGGRLTHDDADAIRRRYKEGALQRELAADYGVTQPHISDIIHYKRRA